MPRIKLTFLHQNEIHCVLCKIPEFTCLVYPLSHHHTAKIIIVIVWREMVKIYEKASFVFYST